MPHGAAAAARHRTTRATKTRKQPTFVHVSAYPCMHTTRRLKDGASPINLGWTAQIGLSGTLINQSNTMPERGSNTENSMDMSKSKAAQMQPSFCGKKKRKTHAHTPPPHQHFP